jgi:hypothetical protein
MVDETPPNPPAIRTHCAHGHAFTPENTYRRPDRPNERACRICRKARQPSRAKENPEKKPHVPTEELRRIVGRMVTHLGATHDQAAFVLGLSRNTLRKHYRAELGRAGITVACQIGQTYVAKCLGGIGENRDWRRADTAALIWFTKSRLGWTDQADGVQPAGAGGAGAVLRLFKLTSDRTSSGENSRTVRAMRRKSLPKSGD